jgi:RNA polymerase sigma-70 factor (ECF subfamily)
MQDADAQDLAQDVLVRIARAIENWEKQPGTRFRHWLRKVAGNAILTALTRSPRDAGAGGSVAKDVLSEHPQSPDAQQELDREFLRERYLRAAAVVQMDVNKETWRAFELTVIEGMSCEDAAELIGKSIGSVYAARSRIIKRLREVAKGSAVFTGPRPSLRQGPRDEGSALRWANSSPPSGSRRLTDARYTRSGVSRSRRGVAESSSICVLS